MSGSNLPQYLVSNQYVPDEEAQSKSHSTDSNSENAPGNEYGDTPSSSEGDSESNDSAYDDHPADDEEERKMKRLLRLMEKNKPDDSDEDDYEGRNKQNRYANVAHDAWYNRDEYDDY